MAMNEQEPSASFLNAFAFLAAGVALGAIVTYILDPENGSRRRATVREKATKLGSRIGSMANDGIAKMKSTAATAVDNVPALH